MLEIFFLIGFVVMLMVTGISLLGIFAALLAAAATPRSRDWIGGSAPARPGPARWHRQQKGQAGTAQKPGF